jgi:hypothetical protein
MRAEPFDKVTTALVEACPSTSSGHISTSSGHISRSSGHTSSIVYLIFTGSVSGAFQVDVTVWFARSVIARERPQQRDLEVGGSWTARLTPPSSAWVT